MTFQQDSRLIVILRKMQLCRNFGVCAEAKYDLSMGHIPNDFSGATGALEQVLLVMVITEPGFPLPDEVHSGEPEEDLKLF